MARFAALLASVTPAALAIVAFAFAIQATVSKDWSSRKHFDVDVVSTVQSNWTLVNYTEYRSPFVICTSTGCQRYAIYGRNQTSCELFTATQDPTLPNLGDERMCQQVHMAGNLAVAATVFIGIAFLITLTMSLFSTFVVLTDSNGPLKDRTDDVESTEEKAATSTTTYKNHKSNSRAKHHQNKAVRYGSRGSAWINFTLIMFFVLGAAMYFLAQNYGVLAFVQSAPDNGAYATNGYLGDTTADGGFTGSTDHQPWIQGKAITVYITVAWFASLLTALSASYVWRLPRMTKVL